jgi:hypothetical protein
MTIVNDKTPATIGTTIVTIVTLGFFVGSGVAVVMPLVIVSVAPEFSVPGSVPEPFVLDTDTPDDTAFVLLVA